MLSFPEILSLISLIYSDVIEVIFCLIYAYILVRISTSRSSEFRSAFYKFSIATGTFLGMVAISNVILNWLMRMIDVRFPFFPNRAIFCNIDSMLSHYCGMATTIGKVLSVSTRYTAICFATRRDFWDGRKVAACLICMFGIPSMFFIVFPFFPAVFGSTANGYGVYLGVAAPGFLIVKAIGTCGYLFFFVSAVPMCVLALLTLRRERITARIAVGRHEKMLGFYAVVLTISHLLKTILQIIWFVALVLGLSALQASVISQYLIANTLSAFAEPVLLLVTSAKLRDEVFPWRSAQETSKTTSNLSLSVLSSLAVARTRREMSEFPA